MVVAAAAVAVVVVAISEVTERILVARILVVRISVALEWVGLGPLTSVAVISVACRARVAISLTLTPRTFTD